MAKLNYSKLKLKPNTETTTIIFNEQEIEVKQYLPINEKLAMISNIIENSRDELRFYNVGKLLLFFTLEVCDNYTNISFTDKQRDDVCKLYDSIVSSGLYGKIVETIGEEELDFVYQVLFKTVESIYKFENSIMGIMDTLSQDYSDLKLDVAELQKDISDPNTLTLLKNIMGKLG